jgi:hypothetical protein
MKEKIISILYLPLQATRLIIFGVLTVIAFICGEFFEDESEYEVLT